MKFLLILSCSFCFAFGSCQKSTVLFHDTFDNDSFFNNWKNKEVCCSYSLKQTDSISFNGKSCARFELRYDDPLVENGKRAELVATNETAPGIDRWYQFSFFLPTDYAIDTVPEILAQWHEIPDFDLGETWRSPPVSLQLNKKEWTLNILWAKDPVNTNQTVSGYKTIKLGNFETNKWTTFRIHIVFSYQQNGIIEIWKNDRFMDKYTGPNYYNDKSGPYFKIGIYKWDWNNSKPTMVKKRVLFVDNVEVTNEKQ